MSRFDKSLLERALRAIGKPAPPSQPEFAATVPGAGEPADEALALVTAMCKSFEGFRAWPYLCAAGYPTTGYGSRYYADGREVTLKDGPISEPDALALLTHELRTNYMPAVMAACPVQMTPPRFAAIADWTYNLGAANLRASTLRRRINADAWGDVPAQLRRWVYAAGQVLRGLVLRREAEARMI